MIHDDELPTRHDGETDDDRTTHREESPSSDRRRERRVRYEHDCMVHVTHPAWAMSREPFHARTEDITINGAKITFQGLPRTTADSWQQAIANDVEIRVEIALAAMAEDFPALPGTVVWLHSAVDEDGEHTSVGVLFSILRQRDQIALLQLIGSLP